MRQTVVAQTSGEVTDVYVTAGSRVSAGTALVSLGAKAPKMLWRTRPSPWKTPDSPSSGPRKRWTTIPLPPRSQAL